METQFAARLDSGGRLVGSLTPPCFLLEHLASPLPRSAARHPIHKPPNVLAPHPFTHVLVLPRQVLSLGKPNLLHMLNFEARRIRQGPPDVVASAPSLVGVADWACLPLRLQIQQVRLLHVLLAEDLLRDLPGGVSNHVKALKIQVAFARRVEGATLFGLNQILKTQNARALVLVSAAHGSLSLAALLAVSQKLFLLQRQFLTHVSTLRFLLQKFKLQFVWLPSRHVTCKSDSLLNSRSALSAG